MTPAAALLVTISAFGHATWNLLGKRSSPTPVFFFLANGWGALLLLPYIWWQRAVLPGLPAGFWLLILATGICQAIYFIGLAHAYRTGDMSLAYPLLRALPVLLVAPLTLWLGQGERISGPGLSGMILVALGCLILPLPGFRQINGRAYLTLCTLFALIAALGTTGYTIIDDAALRQLGSLADLGLATGARTLLFVSLQEWSIALMMGAYLLIRPVERPHFHQSLRRDRSRAALTGVIMVTTYGLVLLAMNWASNVSYVAAFRQLSIPLGALLGMTIQGEPRLPTRFWGIGIIFAGLVLVALG
ncbi:MAG: hypothetical protein KDE59_23100 [Anaerolineales bacterium]|nr:hypothetical protein [Anaerolineales bacterium]MCB8961668.1 multidrug DMT transporter permease [Ardenticatenales bacterium]